MAFDPSGYQRQAQEQQKRDFGVDYANPGIAQRIIDPANLWEGVMDPQGKGYRNRPPEQQWLADWAGERLSDVPQAGSFGSYLGETDKRAAEVGSAQEAKGLAEGTRQSQAIAKNYAGRGITGGMSLGPQIQASNQAQQQMNLLQAQLSNDAYQQAMMRQGEDRMNQARMSDLYTRALQAGYGAQSNNSGGDILGMIGGFIGGGKGGGK